MSESKIQNVTTPVTRRTIIAGAGAAAAGLATAKFAFAQDSTPVASPEATGEPMPLTPAIPPEVTEFANDWPVAQGDLAGTRNAVGATIDSTNVTTLGVAWEIPINAPSAFGAITSNPIVLGDTVYIIDNACNIQAVDRETGAVKWFNEYNVSTFGPNGLALAYGYLVGVLGDAATVITLRPETGEEVWRFQLANHNALGITMAPFVYDGYVIVSTEPGGNSKGTYEGGANGVVYALDLQTGLTLWTWDTVKDDLWGNFRVNSGGGLWYPPSVDTDTGVLYMGIGNAGPFSGTEEYPNASSRPGPNDYANNLVAIDPNAGKVLWNINIKPHDLFDLDNQQTPVLADVDMEGGTRKLVFSTGKHGVVIAVDRTVGAELWRVRVGKHQNDDLQEIPEGESVEVYPGILGGVESPLAYADGVLYICAFNWPTKYTATGFDLSGGLDYSFATANVIALDAATGDYLWEIETPTGIAGPGPTLANDVLFTGGLDGILRAYSTADGTLLWSTQMTGGLNAPFAVAGDLLIVPVGTFVTPSTDTQGEPPAYEAKVVAFKLGAA
ncbi:PQQ-binding-like beta-propeller repeat protein [soil metagenome]